MKILTAARGSRSARPKTITISGRRQVAPTHPRGRSVRVPAWAFATVALVAGAGVLASADAVGWWTTSGTTVAAVGSSAQTSSGERAAPTGADPAEVKGWMTVEQVVAAYGVSAPELFAAFGVPAGTPASTELKDLEGLSGGRFEVTALRDWLTQRQP